MAEMESDTSRDTVGRYLQTSRLKTGLSISDVSRLTRITADCLTALEADDYAGLPPRAYVKSFIRNYARAVGINPDVGINLYLADLNRKDREARRRRKRQANLSVLRNILLVIGLTTSFLLLIRYTDILSLPHPPPGLLESKTAPALRPFILDQGAIPDPPISPPETGDRHVLKVVAVEPTWLKVMIDGQSARSYDLKPEDRLELEGRRNFNLMIGSATGLRISLNGKPVEIYGSMGQIVSLKVP